MPADDGHTLVIDPVLVSWSYPPRRRPTGSAVPEGQVLVRIEGTMSEADADALTDLVGDGKRFDVRAGDDSELDTPTCHLISVEARDTIKRD